MNKVVLASNNAGKLAELQALLGQSDFEVLPQSHFSVPDIEETGLTFVENAILKARNACSHTGLPAIADDSGIEVDALFGQPGIFSARFASNWQSQPVTDALNNQYLLHKMQEVEATDRSARYQCILVYLRHAADPTPIICHGSWEGRILTEEAGSNGFGYDPLFYVPEYNCSSAELDPAVKNKISHRGKALQQLLLALQQLPRPKE